MQSRRAFMGLVATAVASAFVGTVASNIPGIPGVTYFKAPDHDIAGMGYGLYLDGRNVMSEASEADLLAGWVIAYDVSERNEDGSAKVLKPTQRQLFGRVELRPV